MTRVTDESAVVLHLRPYRETSAIVNLLTARHGRLAAVARGVRGGKRGNALQPFSRVRVSYSGRGTLQTLTSCEVTQHVWLAGNALASGFYVIELISRLLVEHESVPGVFDACCWTLDRLAAGDAPDVVLRVFEKRLLEDLGYGLDFSRDAHSGEAVVADRIYVLEPEAGFIAVPAPARGYSGAVLQSIARARFDDRAVRVAARRIFRRALTPLLGPRPLASRRLLRRERA